MLFFLPVLPAQYPSLPSSQLIPKTVRISSLFIATIVFVSNKYRDHLMSFRFPKSFIMSYDPPGIRFTLSFPEGSPCPFLFTQAFPLQGLPRPRLFLLTLAEARKWIWQGLYIKLKWFADILVLILLFGLSLQQEVLPIANVLMVCDAFLKFRSNFWMSYGWLRKGSDEPQKSFLLIKKIKDNKKTTLSRWR